MNQVRPFRIYDAIYRTFFIFFALNSYLPPKRGTCRTLFLTYFLLEKLMPSGKKSYRDSTTHMHAWSNWRRTKKNPIHTKFCTEC